MEGQMKSMIFGLITILFGVALIPIVFAGLSGANWTLEVGTNSYNLSWVGYIVGLAFSISLVGVGVSLISSSFRKK